MLTRAQQRTYDYIRSYMDQHDFSPTVLEIAHGTGIRSKGVIYRYLKALAAANKIRLIPNRKRNIELIDETTAQFDPSRYQWPLLGEVAAGEPIEAIPGYDVVRLDEILPDADLFALRVSGESMVDMGILDGDTIVCRAAASANAGDIVVALIDGHEATLKRWQPEADGSITLLPCNASMQALRYPADRVMVQGVYQGLFRWHQP